MADRPKVTTPVTHLFRRGDRVYVGLRRAIVKETDGTTLTVAYRDSWFWRALWFIGDVLNTKIHFWGSGESR